MFLTSLIDFSGYAFSTTVTDNDWLPDDHRVAVNVNLDHNNLALRGQVTTQENQPRRLALEYSFPTTAGTYYVFQAGRLVRLDGFYNNVTDSPSSSGISILPMAVYNRRMFTGTFTLMDGVSATWNQVGDTGAFDLVVRYGRPFVDDDDNLQKEAFKFVSPAVGFRSRYNNLSVMGKYAYDVGAYLFSYNHYSIDVTNGTPLYPKDVVFDSWKLGVTHDFGDWAITSEYHYGNVQTSNTKSHGIYLMPTYHYSDTLDLYVVGNIAVKEFGDERRIYDLTLGATWDIGRYMANVEFHKGEAENGAWLWYDSPNTKWKSLVFSIAYRF